MAGFVIITLDGEQDANASQPPINVLQLVVQGPGGGIPQPVSNANPLPVFEVFGGSGVDPVLHAFNAVGVSPVLFVPLPGRPFNVDLQFSNDADSCVMVLTRSFDDGGTWNGLTSDGQPVGVYNASASEHFLEPEAGVQYRLAMTERVAGSVATRISQ